MDKNKVIHLSAASVVKALIVIVIFWALFVLRDIVLVILMAVLIASSIEPFTKWLRRRGLPRVVAVLFIYLLTALILAGSFYFLFLPLAGDTSQLLSALPEYLTALEVWNPLRDGFFGQPLGFTGSFSVRQVVDQLSSLLSGPVNFLSAASVIFGGTLSLILIVVVSFYLAVQEGGVAKFLRLIAPLKYEEYVVDLWRRSEVKIGLWMQGQIVLAVVVGVLTYLGLLLLGVPNPLLLAFLAAVLEIIPVFGPIMAAVPAVALAFLDSGLTLALIVVGLYLIIQQFESQLIYPLVVRKVVGVSPIIVIVALVAGFKLAGFLGLILSVPLAAAVLEFLDDLEKRKHGAENSNQPVPPLLN